MARTTAELVKVIIETDLTDPTIEAYIVSATNFIDENLAGAGLSDTILGEIERWLTAHMIASTKERMAKKEEAGGAKIEYTGEFFSGLYSTTYGQTAIMMDSSGTLASLSGGKKQARMIAIKSFN